MGYNLAARCTTHAEMAFVERGDESVAIAMFMRRHADRTCDVEWAVDNTYSTPLWAEAEPDLVLPGDLHRPLVGFSVTGFMGLWPVGTAAIVYATDREACKRVLLAELRKESSSLRRTKQSPDDWTIEPITPAPREAVARVLLDGDY